MTINEALTKIKALKPSQYDDATLVGWLSRLDNKIYIDIILTHEHDDDLEDFTSYSEEDTTIDLLVPAPYDDVYIYYLESQIDYYNQEITKYNNSSAMYNAAYEDYWKYYNRNNLPIHATNKPKF